MIKKTLKKFETIVSVYHFLYSFWGALSNGFPSSKIRVIAITGTNGKTTTTDLIASVFKEAGYRVAISSSARFEINGKEEPNLYKMTMPGKAVVQKLLRRAVKEKCQIAIIEVTSEGIKQHRHRFIHFDTACFTNLSPEHIEAHGGFENYKKEKGKLFKAVKNIHVINIDDENAEYFLQFESKEKLCYGTKKENYEKVEKEGNSFYCAENIKATDKEVNFTVNNDFV
jgi:UDP-N-acetylmuramoyl-L-alanyl-D-glutamate--2,6-diaminopimelate ligase